MTKTILVVEDEKALQAAVEINLKKSGFDVVSVSSAEGAIKALETNNKFDGVWLDHYLLGEETGLDLLCRMKTNKSWASLPVFAVTNSVGDDKVKSYELLGIEKYFVKSNSSLNQIINSIKEAV